MSSKAAAICQLNHMLFGWHALHRYYSLFTLVMLVTFECTVVGQRLKNLSDVRRLQAPKQV